jgi:hypothetical protein
MFATIFGVSVNLIYIVIIVALYDIVIIFKSLLHQFENLWIIEKYDIGCLKDLMQSHCIAIYGTVAWDIICFFVNVLLVCGSKKVNLVNLKQLKS